MATGGASGAGPTFSTGGDQEAGGVVPPYEGRKESADSTAHVEGTPKGEKVGA